MRANPERSRFSRAGRESGGALGETPTRLSAARCCRLRGYRVLLSCSGRVGGAGGCPIVCAGIVSPASIQAGAVAVSTPDDHLAASPDCRMAKSCRGRVDGASSCPSVVNASSRSLRYSGQCVAGTRAHHCITNPVLCALAQPKPNTPWARR